VAARRLHVAEPVEHEPLRPVATPPVLVLVDEREHVSERPRVAGGDEELGRALTDVAQTPRRSAVLLQAVRGGVVDDGIVEVPADDVVEAGEVIGEPPGPAAERRSPPKG